jgi:hypothetical protein
MPPGMEGEIIDSVMIPMTCGCQSPQLSRGDGDGGYPFFGSPCRTLQLREYATGEPSLLVKITQMRGGVLASLRKTVLRSALRVI